MDRKGAELTMNVIIVAVLALIVLVVLLVIFTGRTSTFSKGLKDCASLQGVCSGKIDIRDDKVTKIDCGGRGAPVYNTNCETEAKGCCVEIG